MNRLKFKQVALALGSFLAVTFVLCSLWDLLFPSLTMEGLWRILIPGYESLTWGSFVLGLAVAFAYGIDTALFFVPFYNLFQVRESKA